MEALQQRWQEREFRADLRSGLIAALIAETHRDRKRKPSAFSALDFMPLQRELIEKFRQSDASDLASLDKFLTLARKGKKENPS